MTASNVVDQLVTRVSGQVVNWTRVQQLLWPLCCCGQQSVSGPYDSEGVLQGNPAALATHQRRLHDATDALRVAQIRTKSWCCEGHDHVDAAGINLQKLLLFEQVVFGFRITKFM